MEKRDYLQDLIEKMAQFLRTLLQQLLKNEIQAKTALEQVSSFLNLDIKKLLLENKVSQRSQINTTEGLSLENQELLADLFRVIAKQIRDEAPNSATLYQKLALNLYQNIDQESKMFSTERFQKISNLKSTLQPT